MNADFHEWLDARPMECALDLSQPGETNVPFQQTCSIAHGEAVLLDCEWDDGHQPNAAELLQGLQGSIVIKDADGTAIESVEINGAAAQFWDGKILLARFVPFRNGDYVATIRVDAGAAALAHHQQMVYVKYQLCGLEQMPAAIAGAFAMGAGIVGIIAAVCVLPGLLRWGLWHRPSTTENWN